MIRGFRYRALNRFRDRIRRFLIRIMITIKIRIRHRKGVTEFKEVAIVIVIFIIIPLFSIQSGLVSGLVIVKDLSVFKKVVIIILIVFVIDFIINR